MKKSYDNRSLIHSIINSMNYDLPWEKKVELGFTTIFIIFWSPVVIDFPGQKPLGRKTKQCVKRNAYFLICISEMRNEAEKLKLEKSEIFGEQVVQEIIDACTSHGVTCLTYALSASYLS